MLKIFIAGKTEWGRFFHSAGRKTWGLAHGLPVIVSFVWVSPRYGRIAPVMPVTPFT
jgi:hypothetical protein